MIILIVTFCGHGKTKYDFKTKQKLLYIIEDLIINGATEFLFGGYGNFDVLCAKVVKELKDKYLYIKMVLVIAYLNRNPNLDLYDCSVYPPIESVPPKFAILKRNQWMVENAQVIIAYVQHEWGGAAKTLLFAKKKKKRVINIGEEE